MSALCSPAFADYSASVEMSPLGLAMIATGGDSTQIAGTFTIGIRDSKYEVAVPFARLYTDHGTNECCEYSVDRVDLQLRRFTSTNRHGLYMGLVARASRVRGSDWETQQPKSFSRSGYGMVIGFRLELDDIFGRLTKRLDNYYWGANLHIGRFVGHPDSVATGANGVEFFGPSENGEKRFFNLEVLKFGYRF